MPRKQPIESLYSPHPSIALVQKWIAALPDKTGRTLEEWLQLVRESGPATEKERREWLKAEYNLGTNAAWWIAERAEGKGTEGDSPEAYLRAAVEYVEAMFSGSKAGLRPIYEALLRLAKPLGRDVKACPCKTIVPLYRKHVFAEIKPTTRTRIDLGLALGDAALSGGRLVETGGAARGDRITHRIPITGLAEIDDEVKRWLKVAYELNR
ncbi:MAG TPA: DUF5655 domain-containing protein [Blastocatellia bacterium]|nr:DUF5655 domain-containing protein [Blastocatellia bacterium]